MQPGNDPLKLIEILQKKQHTQTTMKLETDDKKEYNVNDIKYLQRMKLYYVLTDKADSKSQQIPVWTLKFKDVRDPKLKGKTVFEYFFYSRFLTNKPSTPGTIPAASTASGGADSNAGVVPGGFGGNGGDRSDLTDEEREAGSRSQYIPEGLFELEEGAEAEGGVEGREMDRDASLIRRLQAVQEGNEFALEGDESRDGDERNAEGAAPQMGIVEEDEFAGIDDGLRESYLDEIQAEGTDEAEPQIRRGTSDVFRTNTSVLNSLLMKVWPAKDGYE